MANDKSFNRDTNVQSQGLHAVITKFQFIVTLLTVKNCTGYTKALSSSLQERAQDVRANRSVDDVRTALEKVLSRVSGDFSSWYKKASEIAAAVKVDPSLPRVCNRQRNRDNVPAETPEEYYRRSLGIPYLEELVAQLQARFSSLGKICAEGLHLIPPIICQDREPELRLQDKIQRFVRTYPVDLASPLGFNVELALWEKKWRRLPTNHPSTVQDTLKVCIEQDYPNVYALLKVLRTIGVTSCEAERANSELTYLKTYLRATMTQSRMNG
ncbi:52 kDa repressor of the inhibitor of the protein kinase-like [Corticium candelabrum]|uniref:52 kDa repressor of the inhibitor of the protein kinase-like n=1 Tax=Corticium candelabrum TaxID=121492 RepID=UPI002E266FF2|nr:52 kDa repressor of the inhibitor of the protein kinase-like [Corticium candelabrum]